MGNPGWKPGVSGNPLGSASPGALKEKKVLAALERAIAQDNGERIRKGVEVILDLFAKGERWAVEFIADRTDGKPIQQLSASDADGKPLAIAIVNYSDTVQLQPEELPNPGSEGSRLRH
jgi:hypothetical protein